MANWSQKQIFSGLTEEELASLRSNSYTVKSFDTLAAIDYWNFFRNYLVANRPCIFSARVTDAWKSRLEWVAEDGTPNFAFLNRCFGHTVVPVANCKQEQYSSHPKQDLSLSDYLAYWQRYREDGYPAGQDCLYLKDWHFTKVFPEYKAYETPVYFQSDWLNEYWDTLPEDDYRFVYMGPKGTWTPFHSDVYRSFSWSANICGRKKWIFYPPGCEEYLKDKFGQLVYDITSPDLDDHLKFPKATEVKDRAIEVIQEQGQVIFVPSGWHHQVHNLEDTISINHNWLNGCNLDISWRHMVDSLNEVKREIADCDSMEGWHEQCQVILKASAGIDFKMFIDLIETIANNRFKMLEQVKLPEAEAICSSSNKELKLLIQDDVNKKECNIISSIDDLQLQDKTNNAKNNQEATLGKFKNDLVKKDGTDVLYSYSCDTGPKASLCDISPGSCQSIPVSEKAYTCDTISNNISKTTNQTISADRRDTAVSLKDKSRSKCSSDDTGDSLDTTENNNLLSTKYFVLYDLMRIEEVLKLILVHEDLQKLSPDLTVNIQNMLKLICEARNRVSDNGNEYLDFILPITS